MVGRRGLNIGQSGRGDSVLEAEDVALALTPFLEGPMR